MSELTNTTLQYIANPIIFGPDLFSDKVTDEFRQLRDVKWLIKKPYYPNDTKYYCCMFINNVTTSLIT